MSPAVESSNSRGLPWWPKDALRITFGGETLIAVALIAGFARKATYLSAIVFSLLIWATAEGFGGPYTSGASGLGTAINYAVVFAGLLALSAYAGLLATAWITTWSRRSAGGGESLRPAAGPRSQEGRTGRGAAGGRAAARGMTTATGSY